MGMFIFALLRFIRASQLIPGEEATVLLSLTVRSRARPTSPVKADGADTKNGLGGGEAAAGEPGRVDAGEKDEDIRGVMRGLLLIMRKALATSVSLSRLLI